MKEIKCIEKFLASALFRFSKLCLHEHRNSSPCSFIGYKGMLYQTAHSYCFGTSCLIGTVPAMTTGCDQFYLCLGGFEVVDWVRTTDYLPMLVCPNHHGVDFNTETTSLFHVTTLSFTTPKLVWSSGKEELF